MKAIYLCLRFRTCALVVALFTFGFDSVSAQSEGISWGAVGISWVFSTLTTCLLICVAFGIRGCLRRNRAAKAPESGNEDEERREVTVRNNLTPAAVADQPTSGLLSVSQQSAYLRAQNETHKSRKKSRLIKGLPQQEPHDWVEQWCKEQAKRESVVSALHHLNDGRHPNTNTQDEHLSRYPAGLELPTADIGRKTRTERNTSAIKHGVNFHKAVPQSPPTCEFCDETRMSLKQEHQNVVRDSSHNAQQNKLTGRGSNFQATAPESLTPGDKNTAKLSENGPVISQAKTEVVASANRPQDLMLRIDAMEELKSSPVRIHKQPRDVEKRQHLPHVSAKTPVLEFKRPSGETVGNVAHGALLSSKNRQVEAVEESFSASSSSSSSEEEEETEEESMQKEEVNPLSASPQNHGKVTKSKQDTVITPKKFLKQPISSSSHNDTPAKVASPKSFVPLVGSTPPNPTRPTSTRRTLRSSKPSTLNVVPIPTDGVSPPPGLLPLTASSHHLVTKTQRQTAVVKEKSAPSNVVETKQESAKRRKAKDQPLSIDLKNKRPSSGSEIVFFAPELQGTSTPAMKPKSAFVPIIASLLSSDTADDDDKEVPKVCSSLSKGATTVASRLSAQKLQLTLGSRSQQFHGLLSDNGLHKMARYIYQEWQQMANSLHIPVERQTWLVGNYASDVEKCTFEMLKGWRDSHFGSKSDVRSSLCNALVAANHSEMAERLIQEEMIGSMEKLDSIKLVSVV